MKRDVLAGKGELRIRSGSAEVTFEGPKVVPSDGLVVSRQVRRFGLSYRSHHCRSEMAKPAQTRLLLVRVQPDEPDAHLHAVSIYLPETFRSLLSGLHPLGLKLVNPSEVTIRNLGQKLSQRLHSFGSSIKVAIVIDATRETLPYDTYYDDLLVDLYRAGFLRTSGAEVCCVTVAVSRPDLLRQATAFPHLVDRLKERGIALCLVDSIPSQSETGSTQLSLKLEQSSSGHTQIGGSESVA